MAQSVPGVTEAGVSTRLFVLVVELIGQAESLVVQGQGVLAGPVGTVNRLAFSPDSQMLASGENSSAILLWDMRTRSIVATLTGSKGTVTGLGFAPDGSVLVSGSNARRIIAWDAGAPRLVRPAVRVGVAGGTNHGPFSQKGF